MMRAGVIVCRVKISQVAILYWKLPIHRCYIRWYQYMPISFAFTACPTMQLVSGQVNWPNKEGINNNT